LYLFVCVKYVKWVLRKAKWFLKMLYFRFEAKNNFASVLHLFALKRKDRRSLFTTNRRGRTNYPTSRSLVHTSVVQGRISFFTEGYSSCCFLLYSCLCALKVAKSSRINARTVKPLRGLFLTWYRK
jgi:hypothetical protein